MHPYLTFIHWQSPVNLYKFSKCHTIWNMLLLTALEEPTWDCAPSVNSWVPMPSHLAHCLLFGSLPTYRQAQRSYPLKIYHQQGRHRYSYFQESLRDNNLEYSPPPSLIPAFILKVSSNY